MKDIRQDIIGFWFLETAPALWFQVNEDFDQGVRARFGSIYDMARMGVYDDLRNDPDGSLALCILFDQFPRNMFRGTARAYESDPQGILVAKLALSKGFDQVLPLERRRFMYLPFEHSENINDQRRSVQLFEKIKGVDPLSYDYALRHMRVIEKFGRFPHRNAILGRVSTPEENDFLCVYPQGF